MCVPRNVASDASSVRYRDLRRQQADVLVVFYLTETSPGGALRDLLSTFVNRAEVREEKDDGWIGGMRGSSFAFSFEFLAGDSIRSEVQHSSRFHESRLRARRIRVDRCWDGFLNHRVSHQRGGSTFESLSHIHPGISIHRSRMQMTDGYLPVL